MNKAAPSLQTKSDSLGSNIIVGPMATVSNETAVALTNRSPAHIMLLDSNNKIADVNERCERLLEQSAAELRGTSPENVFEAILNRVQSIGSERAQRGFKLHYNHAWYDAQVFETGSLSDKSPGQDYRVIRATDITDRKSAEFELLESEARLEEVTRIARMGTYKLYWDTMKVIWSHQMYDIHGLIPGKFDPADPGYNALVHPEDQQGVKDLVRDLISGKEKSGSEYRIIRNQSDIRWVRLDGRVLFDAEGKPYATFGTIQDITEAKEREEELKDLVSRNTILTEALQASPIGVAILTAESDEPVIFYVNSALERVSVRSVKT